MSWKFWKHEEDPLADLSAEFSPSEKDPFAGLDMPQAPGPGQGMQESAQFPTAFPSPEQRQPGVAFTPVEQPHDDGGKQALLQELILARLDLIKNQLDVLNQRVANLEREPSPQQAPTRGPWYTQSNK